MINGEVEPHEHAQWAQDYRAMCRWAMSMAANAPSEHAANQWRNIANTYIDKVIEHRIMAQDYSKKDR